MLEKLLNRSTLRDTVKSVAEHPCEAARTAVSFLREELRARLSGATEAVERYRHGVDGERVKDELQQMLSMDKGSRRAQMRIIFDEALNEHPATFYDLVKTLGEIDLFDLVLKSKEGGDLDAEDLLLPLQLDYEIYIELIRAAQSNPYFSEWMDHLSNKVKNGKNHKDSAEEELKLNGAALPEMFPKINQYVASTMRYAGGGSSHRGEKFEVMVKAFKKITGELFGERMDAFFGVATTKNLAGLVSRFWSFHPNAELVAGAYEYLPMYYSISDPNKRHLADLEDINFDEEQLVASLLKNGEAIRTRRIVRAIPKEEPIVLLVSTQMRIGAKLMDTKKIAELIEAENVRIGHKQYHVWFDASQDSRLVADGDIVFYSKRFAGSGGGMVLANKETYPDDDGKDITEALRLRSSYDSSIIPRLIASLHLTSNKVGHTVSNLTQTPGLWYYRGKGTFVASEVEKASIYLNASPLLKGLFSIECQMPTDPQQWKVDAVLRVTPSDAALEKLDVAKLGDALKNDFGVDCSSYSLNNMGKDGSMSFSRLNQALEATPFDLDGFIAMVEEFQFFYQSWIVKALLPSENRNDAEYVKDYFRQAAKEHNYFRLLITALDRPDYLLDFVKRLETAVSQQLRTPSR